MPERLKISQEERDQELKTELEKIDWPIDYGTIKVQIRNGKPAIATIEETIKLD